MKRRFLRGTKASLLVGGAAADDEFRVADAAAIRVRATFSIEVWARHRFNLGVVSTLLTKYDDATNGYHVFTNGANTGIFFGVQRAGVYTENSVWLPLLDHWQHYVFSYNAGAHVTYINGKRAELAGFVQNLPIESWTTFLSVGGSRPGGFNQRQFPATVSNLVLRSLAPTDAQVEALYLYNTEPGSRLAGWPMDEGNGNVLYDTEGANNGSVASPPNAFWLPGGP